MSRPNGNEVRQRLIIMSGVDTGELEITPGQRGACVGTMNKYFGDDDMRKMVLGWLFADPFVPLSSKELTPGQWYAIYNWIGWSKTDDGEALVGDLFIKEHAAVLSEACRDFMELSADQMAKFGISVFDMALTAVGYLGGEITHTFDPNQEVVYDFSEWKRLQSERRKERNDQIMRELGYDDDDPKDVLGKF